MRLRRLDDPAGDGVERSHGLTPYLIAEGSFAGLSRKCAWSGCSSAIMVSPLSHRPPYLIITLFYSLSLIGPFYPSSYLLLPSFYPKAYHYGRGKKEEGRILRCKMVEGRRKSFMMEDVRRKSFMREEGRWKKRGLKAEG